MILPTIFFRRSKEALDRDRYRGLRGIAKHITRLPAVGENQRKAVGNFRESYQKGGKPPWGTCKWCLLSVPKSESGRPRMWHEHCHEYRQAAQGAPTGTTAIRGDFMEIQSPYGGTNERLQCPACGKADFVSMELDHIMAIGVAKRFGLWVFKRAFTPENLWLICEPCHRAKTAFDRAFMRALDNRVTAAEEMSPPPIPKAADPQTTPLFDWAAAQTHENEESITEKAYPASTMTKDDLSAIAALKGRSNDNCKHSYEFIHFCEWETAEECNCEDSYYQCLICGLPSDTGADPQI